MAATEKMVGVRGGFWGAFKRGFKKSWKKSGHVNGNNGGGHVDQSRGQVVSSVSVVSSMANLLRRRASSSVSRDVVVSREVEDDHVGDAIPWVCFICSYRVLTLY